MDFVDYGGCATFLHIQDTSSRFSVAILLGTKKREEQTAEMAREAVISNWLAVFGAPDILIVDKDERSIGNIFQDFCTSRNITLQTVIPGHHQSLGATERRHAHFRGIIDHIIGNRKSNCLSNKQWGEISAMAALRLNSQVQQYGGFTPGQRVLGGRQNCRSERCVILIFFQFREANSRPSH